MNRSTKFKLITSSAVLLINIICTAFVFWFSVETTALKIVGSYVAVFLVSGIIWVFPTRLYVLSLSFVVFACSLGSCINLYYYVKFYDLFVHFLSGILLFEGGRIIIETVNKKRGQLYDRVNVGMFSIFFSCSCASVWEIYEFLCDVLINANMQGTKFNTMGDIIAGTLGAVVGFGIFCTVGVYKNKHDKKIK